MFNIKRNTSPRVCQTQFTEIQHHYSPRFSKNSSDGNQLVYNHTKFYFSARGPRLWYLLDHKQKVQKHKTSKKLGKLSLLSLESEIRFFWHKLTDLKNYPPFLNSIFI